MTDPRTNEPRRPDPLDPADPAFGDDQERPVSHHTVVTTNPPPRDRFGLVAAGVIAVLLVIALIAFGTGPGTDSDTTAAVPEASDQAVPEQEAAPDASQEGAPIEDDAPAAVEDEEPAPAPAE